MRINLLCGPPCAGKTTLAHQQSRPGDAVLDFDDIARALGSPDPWQHPEPYRTMADQEFQAQLRWLTTATRDGTGWVIRSAPRPNHRAQLAHSLNATVYLVDPGKAECLRRADQRPGGTRRAINTWYHHYRPWVGDRPALELTATTQA